jgi:hypothetical protein
MAPGAQRSQVLWQVLRETMMLVMIGNGCRLAGALASTLPIRNRYRAILMMQAVKQRCTAREASRTRSTTTKDNVRKQCAKALKTDACDMNAQDGTLRNVTLTRFRIARNFCGL